MYRYRLAIIIFMLFLGGCALPQAPTVTTVSLDSKLQLDALLVQAALLESHGLLSQAAKTYKKAYKLSGDKQLLYRYIQTLYRLKAYDEAYRVIKEAQKRYKNDQRLWELLATVEYERGHLNKAAEAIKKAIAMGKKANDLEFLATLYLKQKRFEEALKYYKSAYAMDPKSSTVSSIAYIMYFYLDKKREAIAYLETHIRLYGCDKIACGSLIALYGHENNIDGLISTYSKLYETYGNKEFAKKVMEFYIYQKEYDQALRWAKIVGDEKVLLDLYRATKRYDKAFELARHLFAKTHDYNYLALEAMFEYERAKKKDRKLLEDVVKKFDKALKHVQDPVYLNYLGYLLIDHDMDVQRGIELVKKALSKEPDSGYYLDSLAWGYYKQGKCKEALKIMKRVYFDMNLKDPEVELHLKKIEQCAKKDEQ